ncbi:1,4-alpha-glucan branching enzyme [Kutzneria kofuensis]|uniref:1,4-alpha-glucan branching enzyme n=1 Tax=Kutzneria kofuensis TaxID=103725 RepID=A0A7W9KQR0_9PSEU|nr:1,4-alpha-glucan branching enzyme [Kutzneria kofuensis]MBB5897000.1 1,4-alpha-glucan branching enzyme [Kutzneria kofuensis]
MSGPTTHALGAHVSADGVRFGLWAPNAHAVRVGLDDGSRHELTAADGRWTAEVPGVGPGARYQFAVTGADGVTRIKADPLAFAVAADRHDVSVVEASNHVWTDEKWLARRRGAGHRPMSVYEVHVGSWRPGLGYRELARPLAEHVRDSGFTHVEFLPLTAHPFAGSWGYQVTSYFAPEPRWGSPDDLRFLVDTLHAHDIGVVLDWVPGHFARDEWALGAFDGTPLYEHPDPRLGYQPEWDTFVFDYGRAEVQDFLLASVAHWIEQYHVDAIRVDAVSSMLCLDFGRAPGQWRANDEGGCTNPDAVDFLHRLNDTTHEAHPGVLTVAEAARPWPGITAQEGPTALRFDRTWNLGWTHDTLGYVGHPPTERPTQHELLLRPFDYADDERFVLPFSHDEVGPRAGSLWSRLPGDSADKAAALRVLLALQWALPGDKLLFMGTEFGARAEWSHERGLDWGLLSDPRHGGLRSLVRELNRLARTMPTLRDRQLFTRPTQSDAHLGLLTFARPGPKGRTFVFVANLSNRDIKNYRPSAIAPNGWSVGLDTDDPRFNGRGADQPEQRPLGIVRLRPSQALWLFGDAAHQHWTPSSHGPPNGRPLPNPTTCK